MVLPLASVARMVTATPAPAVTVEVMVETSKWSTELGITVIGGLVMAVIDPLVRSVTVRVCVPTVPRETPNRRNPFTRAPLSGVFAAASLEDTRTLSALGTGFHHVSVA